MGEREKTEGGSGRVGEGEITPSPPLPLSPSDSSALLNVQLGPLKLKNPIVTASGTFGYGLEFTDWVDLAGLGGLCTKGLSLHPHAGNAPPRICETPAGMLNAIGLQGIGVRRFVDEKLPELRARGARSLSDLLHGQAQRGRLSLVTFARRARRRFG